MSKHHCSNSDVKIVTVTVDLIEAVCEKCGKTGRAERKDYFEFEWRPLVEDALTKHEPAPNQQEDVE